jgi:hypothetical protein
MSTKKTILLSITLVISLCTFAQKISKSITKPVITKTASPNLHLDSLITMIDSLIKINNNRLKQIELDNSKRNRYKLYKTENIYTFLQLDTMTGQIEQFQWSLDLNNEGSVTINGDVLAYGYCPNCFELYPTNNLYQFILLNKTTGQKWHVQWGVEASRRWIRRIN